MTGQDLLTLVRLKLDAEKAVTFYPAGEILANGINPAQRLLVLLKPELLIKRTTVSVLADQAFIDLRQSVSDAWGVKRVVLGAVGTGSTATGEILYDDKQVVPLMTLDQLAWRRDWFSQRGKIRAHYRFGRYLIGLYKRPITQRTVTVIYNAIPTELREETLGDSPDIAEVHHPLIADVAAALLLVKEGVVEIDKAISMLSEVFGAEVFKGMRKTMERMQRVSAKNVVAETA